MNNSSEGVQIDEVLNKINLSKATLNKYISAINVLGQKNKVDIQLTVDNQNVTMYMGNNVTWQQIIYLFLNQSSKYPLLIHLFNNRELTIMELSGKLVVSEATVSRQISSLNQLLKEFSLKIRNGKLVGPEHLIEYFYYRLFLEVLPEEFLSKLIQNKNLFHQVAQLENILNINLSIFQKYKVSLWLLIVLKRMNADQRDFKEIESLMEPYKDDVFYRRIYRQSRKFFNHYKVSFEEGEVMCIFSFLISMEILDPPIIEKFLGFGGPIMNATRLGVKSTKHVAPHETNINQYAMYEMSQIFSTMYFFKGDILIDSLKDSLEEKPVSNFLHFEILDDAIDLYNVTQDKVFMNDQGDLGDLEKASKNRLTYVLSFMKEEKNKIVRVGIDVPENIIYTRPLMNMLKFHLQQDYLVNVEWYDSGEEYDLIISGHYYRPYINEFIYYLKGNLSHYDLVKIIEIINQFLEERK